MRSRFGTVVLLAALTAAACGGGGGDDGADAREATSSSAAATTKVDAAELPQFSSDFDRVCTTQVGYPGATAYEPGPGYHPVILFEEHRGDSWVASSRQLPQGWTVKEDQNYQDNTELKAIELVACADQVKTTPTGKICEFDDDGEKVKLELVDATFELKVYAATTGKELQKSTIEASEKGECPYFAAFKKGDKTYVSTPDDEDYVNGLKALVAPS